MGIRVGGWVGSKPAAACLGATNHNSRCWALSYPSMAPFSVRLGGQSTGGNEHHFGLPGHSGRACGHTEVRRFRPHS